MSQSDLFLSDYQIFVYLLQKQSSTIVVGRSFIVQVKQKNEFQNEEKILVQPFGPISL